MKSFLLSLFLFTTFAEAKVQGRKVSNSAYVRCTIDRMASDEKKFNRPYLFPYPTSLGETYELKASMRWNSISITFTPGGVVTAKISETYHGQSLAGEKVSSAGKDPGYEHFTFTVDVKGAETSIPYVVTCQPE